MKLKMFAIPNCDTVKKARTALEMKKIEYEFVDFKKIKPNKKDILRWKDFYKDWPVNTKGPTFRKIKDQFQAANDAEKISLLIENSSAIKRPILEKDDVVISIGYSDLENYGSF